MLTRLAKERAEVREFNRKYEIISAHFDQLEAERVERMTRERKYFADWRARMTE